VRLELFCGASCIAEACCTEPMSATADATKRNRAKRFTAILLSEIPRNAIESQVSLKVSRFEMTRAAGINVRWRSSGGVILFQRQGKSWEITLVDRAGGISRRT